MNIALTRSAEALHGFWSWWRDEMAAMLPAKMRGDPTERDRLDIFLSLDETVIETVESGEARRMLEPSILEELPQESWEQIEDLSLDRKPRLFLNETDFLAIPITMPNVSANQLSSAVALQLPVLSPITPDQIDWGFVEAARGENDISLILIIVRSSRLDMLEECFAERGLMPPTFCAEYQSRTAVLRKPLEISRRPAESKKMIMAMAATAMLAMIPITTIGGAEMLTSLNLGRAERLEQDLAPRLAEEKEAQREEMTRRAAAPLLNLPSGSNILEALAQNLPASDWTVSSSQSPDGMFEFVADMAERDEAEAALRKAQTIGRFEVAEEIATENLRARVRYRMMR